MHKHSVIPFRIGMTERYVQEGRKFCPIFAT